MVVVDGHLLAAWLRRFARARAEHVGKQVGHGHQPGVRVGVQGVDGRSGSPPAAADQADPQMSLPAACALREIGRPAARADPSSIPDCLRKPRREAEGKLPAEERHDMVGPLFERVEADGFGQEQPRGIVCQLRDGLGTCGSLKSIRPVIHQRQNGLGILPAFSD